MVNQPLNNRGDESAHKALVRRLAKEYPNYEINVLFEKSANIQELLTDRIHRRYGMRDPCSTPESEKNKGSEI